MRLFRTLRRHWLIAIFLCITPSASAVNITIDYTYDSTNFFGAGNPQGAAAGLQAKTTIEAAAAFYSNLLTDSFSVVQTPPEYHSTAGGSAVWHWTADFENPSTGADAMLTDLTIPANQYRIYVGAQSLNGNEAGHGGPGGHEFSFNAGGNFNSQSEFDQILATEAEFKTEVEHRDQPTGFADWGGTIAFGSNTTWNYDLNTLPSASQTDFFSVALHEFGHTLGIGGSDEWNALLNNANPANPLFTGAVAEAAFGGPVPESPNHDHFKDGTNSTIYGTSTSQIAVMTPTLLNGTRRKATTLDMAALSDIGWSVAAPPVLVGDYNGNGIVDAADYIIWRKTLGSTTDLHANGDNTGTSAGKIDQADYTAWKSNFGHTASGASAGLIAAVPEPAAWLLLAIGIAMLASRRSQHDLRSVNPAVG